MGMWRLKDCPRCGGDTFIDADIYGWYQQCLQCSYRCAMKEMDAKGSIKKKSASGTAK